MGAWEAVTDFVPPGVGQSKKFYSPDLFDDVTGTYPKANPPATVHYPTDAQGRIPYYISSKLTTGTLIWPTTYQAQTAINPALAYDSEGQTVPPAAGAEATTFTTLAEMNVDANAGMTNPSQRFYQATDTTTYIFSGGTVTNPTIKIVWDGIVYWRAITDVRTFNCGGPFGEPIKNLPQDFSSRSDVEINYSTDGGGTWNGFDWLSSDFTPWGGGVQSTDRTKSAASIELSGTFLLNNIRIRITLSARAQGIYSCQSTGGGGGNYSYVMIDGCDASASANIYAVYLEGH